MYYQVLPQLLSLNSEKFDEINNIDNDKKKIYISNYRLQKFNNKGYLHLDKDTDKVSEYSTMFSDKF